MGNPVRIGERRGALTIVDRAGTSENSARHVIWQARCDCGAVVCITTPNFRHKDREPSCSKCGHERTAVSRRTHGDARKTRLYRIWANMRRRCEAPTADNYRWYGARGIAVCPEWGDFAVFRAWANANGYSDKLTIDRIKSEKGYEPGNCRWVTLRENIEHRDACKRMAA